MKGTKWWTKKRQINVGLFAIWLALLVIFGVVVQPEDYGNWILPVSQEHLNANVGIWRNATGIHAYTQTFKTTLSASGALSVQNGISYTVIDTESGDIPPAGIRFSVVGFSNATYTPDSQVVFVEQSKGIFKATGTLIFPNEGRTYFFITTNQSYVVRSAIPYVPFHFNKTDISNHNVLPFLGVAWTIGPIADTEAAVFNERIVQFTFIFGSFSVLFLQPIIEGIVIRTKHDE